MSDRTNRNRSLREIGETIDELAEATTELRELGDEANMVAIERNAKRIEGILEIAEQHVPPELVEEE